jgi:hypothetical protein
MASQIPHRTHPDDYAPLLIGVVIEEPATGSDSSVPIEGGLR